MKKITSKEKDKITKLSEEQINKLNETGNFEEVEKISISKEEAEKLPKIEMLENKADIKKAKINFYTKLAQIQAEDIEVKKSAYMNFKDYYYANLDDILKAYKPLLSQHGLVVVNNVDFEKMILTTRVIDVENPELEEKATWKITGKDSQTYGASITYGKRYLISALLNVATGEDFDGESPATIEKAAQQGYWQPNQQTAPQTKSVAKKPVQQTQPKTPAPAPQVRTEPVKVQKKSLPISEKQIAFAKDLYEKYVAKRGQEAWSLEEILRQKYNGKTTLESLSNIQAKDLIDNLLKKLNN